MNLWASRRYRFYIYQRRGTFWTGRAWTNIAQFGKPYEFTDALAVLQKRFSRTQPAPKIRHCTDFHAKPKPPKPPKPETKAQAQAKKKAKKKADKKAKATGNGRRRNSDGASGRLPAD